MTSAQQIRISVHGVDFVCLTQGSGPLVLLVHGFPDIPQSWSAQIDALSHQGYRVVAPYLPGYLPSRIERGAYLDKASLVHYLAGLIEQISPGESLHYIGQDWGAIIGYGLCAARPDLITSAVLMAVPHPTIVNKYLLSPKHIHRSFHWWFFQQRDLPEQALTADDMTFIDYLWSYWTSEGYKDEEHIRQVKQCLKQPGVLSTALAYYRAMFDPEVANPSLSTLRNSLSNSISVPTLALCGADDLRAELMREQADCFVGEYHYIEVLEAGHFLHREQSDQVNKILINWLGSTAGNNQKKRGADGS
ncbi:MAG: alpha/beta hydrolase [Oxalobacteraceae bacterium]|nr:alpha/beta hydrolase [Oxalobacteraceae bacterium]